MNTEEVAQFVVVFAAMAGGVAIGAIVPPIVMARVQNLWHGAGLSLAIVLTVTAAWATLLWSLVP